MKIRLYDSAIKNVHFATAPPTMYELHFDIFSLKFIFYILSIADRICYVQSLYKSSALNDTPSILINRKEIKIRKNICASASTKRIIR